MSNSLLTCLHCGQPHTERVRASFLGTRRFTCTACSQANEYPMTRRNRAAFTLALIVWCIGMTVMLANGGIPGLLSVAVTIALPIALVNDYRLRRAATAPMPQEDHKSLPQERRSFRQESPTMKRMAIAAATIGLAAFAIFVWPTRYRYDHTMLGDQLSLVRIDRFTGKTSLLSGLSWYPIEEYRSSAETTATTGTQDAKPPVSHLFDSLPDISPSAAAGDARSGSRPR